MSLEIIYAPSGKHINLIREFHILTDNGFAQFVNGCEFIGQDQSGIAVL